MLMYYFPGAKQHDLFPPGAGVSHEFLRTRGVGDSLRELRHAGQTSFQQLTTGPDNGSGLLVLPFNGSAVAVYRSGWEWTECIPGKLWIGHDPSKPVTPQSLARKKQLAGYRFEAYEEIDTLVIPVVRSPREDRVTIPLHVYFDQAGRMVRTVRAGERALWEALAPAWDLLTAAGGDREPLTAEQGIPLACDIIGLNYRYGLCEQRVLGWLTTANWTDVLYLALDLPLIVELNEEAEASKKKLTAENEALAS